MDAQVLDDVTQQQSPRAIEPQTAELPLSRDEIIRYLLGSADDDLVARFCAADEIRIPFIPEMTRYFGEGKPMAKASQTIEHPVDRLIFHEIAYEGPAESEATIGLDITTGKLVLTRSSHGTADTIEVKSVNTAVNSKHIVALIHVHDHPVLGMLNPQDMQVLFSRHRREEYERYFKRLFKGPPLGRDSTESFFPHAMIALCPEVSFLAVASPETPLQPNVVPASYEAKRFDESMKREKDSIEAYCKLHFGNVHTALQSMQNREGATPAVVELRRRVALARLLIDQEVAKYSFRYAGYQDIMLYASEDRDTFVRIWTEEQLLEYFK